MDCSTRLHTFVRRSRSGLDRQALRRAVSTAYYALFHLLVGAACERFIPGQSPERGALRHGVRPRRHEAHLHLLAGGTLPDGWKTVSGAVIVPNEQRTVANAFVELQEARHEADYDLRRGFTRQEAVDLVAQCDAAFAAWARCRKSHLADTYLVALLVNKLVKR